MMFEFKLQDESNNGSIVIRNRNYDGTHPSTFGNSADFGFSNIQKIWLCGKIIYVADAAVLKLNHQRKFQFDFSIYVCPSSGS